MSRYVCEHGVAGAPTGCDECADSYFDSSYRYRRWLEARLAAAERVVEAARVLASLASSSATILSLDSEVDELCDAVRAYDATTSPTPKPPRS